MYFSSHAQASKAKPFSKQVIRQVLRHRKDAVAKKFTEKQKKLLEKEGGTK